MRAGAVRYLVELQLCRGHLDVRCRYFTLPLRLGRIAFERSLYNGSDIDAFGESSIMNPTGDFKYGRSCNYGFDEP